MSEIIRSLKGNAVIGQSGGPTAAINATLSGVIRGAEKNPEIDKIYGMKNGIEGLIEKRFVDLRNALPDEESHLLLECTPASALGSCRKKLPDPDSEDSKDKELYENIFRIFSEYNIRYFFYIGGNDSMDTVDKLSKYAGKLDYQINIMGVPKTIDNDLYLTDHTPGFGSAAKFVAATVQEIAADCAVYTVKAVTIIEIMGRDAGWLTLAAGLPRLNSGRCADLIYLPERTFDYDEFIISVKRELEKKPNVVIAVSEGLTDKDGRYVGEGAQSGAVDIFGHKYLAGCAKQLEYLVKEKIGCKVRSIELSLPQRCAAHLLSKCDIEESVMIGAAAVDYAVKGETGKVVIFSRDNSKEYSVSVECVPVCYVANKIKTVPESAVNSEGDNVTDEILKEIEPLIQGEIQVPVKNGLPIHFII